MKYRDKLVVVMLTIGMLALSACGSSGGSSSSSSSTPTSTTQNNASAAVPIAVLTTD